MGKNKKKVEVLPAESDLPPEKTKEELRLERDMKILTLRNTNNLSYPEITKRLDCSLSTVARVCQKYGNLLNGLEDLALFKANKADILESAQVELLKSALSSDKLDASTAQQLINSAEKLNNMKRLEEGKSTSNQELHIKSYTD